MPQAMSNPQSANGGKPILLFLVLVAALSRNRPA
jgi:hypothetical protein